MSFWGRIKGLFGGERAGGHRPAVERPRFEAGDGGARRVEVQDIDLELLEAEYADSLEEVCESGQTAQLGVDAIEKRVRGLRVPFPQEHTLTALEKAFMRSVRERIEAGRYRLPVIRHTTLAVMEILSDPAADVSELTRLISGDQVLTTRTLKLANSALLGGIEETTDLRYAIVRAGMRRLKSMMMFVSTQSVILQGGEIGALATKLWEHSSACAIFARGLAELAELDAEEMFVAGLLHDIGKIVILELARETSDRMKQYFPPEFILGGLFDVYHGRIGGQVAREWHLPEEVALVVEGHHDTNLSGEHGQRVALVDLANLMTRSLADLPALIRHPSFERAGLASVDLDQLVHAAVGMVCQVSERLVQGVV